ADSDYQALSETLTFLPAASLSQQVTVLVGGDTTVENDETFSVDLSDPEFNGVVDATRATLSAAATGIGTIVNDDTAAFSITPPVSHPEGNSGTTPFVFTVTMSNPVAAPTTVVVNTADGTATLADNDYQALSETLTFLPAASLSQQVTVLVGGDTTVENDETFSVDLSDPEFNGVVDATRATLSAAATGTGTIVNDDTAAFSITAAVSHSEGNTGTTPFVFTVTMSNPVAAPTTVVVNTADGTATLADSDYQALNETLTFLP